MKIFTVLLKKILLTLVLLLGVVTPADQIDMFFGIVLFLYVFYVVVIHRYTRRPKKSSWPSWIWVVPILLIFIITGLRNSFNVRLHLSQEPITETYRSDLDDFLKTYYLMNHGLNYYQSFSQAVAEDAFKGRVAASVWVFRLPTLFYFWHFFTLGYGNGLHYLFLLNCLVIFIVAYEIVRHLLSPRDQQLALIAPYFLYPYLHYGVRDTILLHTEWWMWLPLMFGIFYWLSKKYTQAAIFFAVSVSIRELLIFPLAFCLLVLFLFRDRRWKVFVLPCVVLFIIFPIHAHFVRQVTIYSNEFISRPLQFLGKKILLATFAFGAWEYFFFRIRVLVIFYAIAVCAVLKNWSFERLPLLSLLLFPLLFPFIASSIYNDYWGILFIPAALMAVPLVFEKT